MAPQWKALHIEKDVKLKGPLKKDWHARRCQAYLIRVRDSVTHRDSLILTQKLSAAAAYLNQNAHTSFERVSAKGLYQAADKTEGYTGGFHKMKYLVSRCELADAHIAFERARALGVERATLLTDV